MPRIALSTTLIAVAMVWPLGGCTFAPGMTMSEPLQTNLPGWPEADQGPSIIPISEDLIAELKTARNHVPADLGITPEPAQTYRIGPGDELAVTVWGHPELNAPDSRADGEKTTDVALHVVREDGSLFFPWAGRVKAQGKSAEELRVLLSQSLRGVIKNPQISLRITGFHSQGAYVGGEVEKPGRQAISDLPMRATDAINAAGGATEFGDLRKVALRRDHRQYQLDLQRFYETGDERYNPYLKDGDILKLGSLAGDRIFVMGEVIRPGQQFLNGRDISITEALAAAGGPDQTTANTAQIYVIRDNGKKQAIYRLNAHSAGRLALASQFPLEPRDVVFVDAAGITRWARFVSQILPSATALQRASATDFPLFHGSERQVRR